MKISVVIPVYNGKRYIEEAVYSILNQPYKNIEIICIEDGGTDNSLAILQAIEHKEERVKVYSQKNSGVASARNLGINKASGHFIAFLDQDDKWVEDVLDSNLMAMIKESTPDIISFEYIEANQELKRGRYIKHTCNSGIEAGGGKCFINNFRHHSAYLFKREVLIRNGIKVDKFRHEDERFRTQCVYFAKEIMYVSKPFFIYRNNQYSVTHSKNVQTEDVLISCIQGYLETIRSNQGEKDLINYCEGILNRLMLELRLAFEQNEKLLSCGEGKRKYEECIHSLKVDSIINREKIWISEIERNVWKREQDSPFLFKIRYNILENIKQWVKECLKHTYFFVKIYEQKKYPIALTKEIWKNG